MIEVEKKYWIRNNKEEILKWLHEKAIFKKETRKEDIYFIGEDHNCEDLNHQKDKIFRIRKTENSYVVTFKEKMIRQGIEVNKEGEFSILDKAVFEQFVDYLGFVKLVEKIKESKLFIYDGVLLEYNYLHDLGFFLEGEILCEKEDEVEDAIQKLNQVFKVIGLTDNDLEERMYIELLLERKKK